MPRKARERKLLPTAGLDQDAQPAERVKKGDADGKAPAEAAAMESDTESASGAAAGASSSGFDPEQAAAASNASDAEEAPGGASEAEGEQPVRRSKRQLGKPHTGIHGRKHATSKEAGPLKRCRGAAPIKAGVTSVGGGEEGGSSGSDSDSSSDEPLAATARKAAAAPAAGERSSEGSESEDSDVVGLPASWQWMHDAASRSTPIICMYGPVNVELHPIAVCPSLVVVMR
jgi:hypothetical protein